ncbi:hypothetical protein [Ruegeria sp.]|uniref:hypothetical protein n=1 Tax=Ruegeria sp. TaxID=1879320 RepID=UPI003B5BFA76
MLKELGCYGVGFGLVGICFVGGNLIADLVWGLSADYSGWFGPLRAIISIVPGLVAYYIFAPQISFMGHRHLSLPPILLGVVGLVLVGAIVGLAYIQGVHAEAITLEMVSSLVPFVGWAGFGFWLMAQPAESHA